MCPPTCEPQLGLTAQNAPPPSVVPILRGWRFSRDDLQDQHTEVGLRKLERWDRATALGLGVPGDEGRAARGRLRYGTELVSKAAEWREGTHYRVEVDASARSVDAIVHASETKGYQHH